MSENVRLVLCIIGLMLCMPIGLFIAYWFAVLLFKIEAMSRNQPPSGG